MSDGFTPPRRFRLVRHDDNTGTSGEGIVAYGVEYCDGAAHMMWNNEHNDALETDSNGVAFKPAPDGIKATTEIHGHGGKTVVEYLDNRQLSDWQFRALLDLVMAADPSPLNETDDDVVRSLLNSEANARGYDGWIEAYHEVSVEAAE